MSFISHVSFQTLRRFLIPLFAFHQNDFVVETSLVGTVFNGLSHLNAVTERGQFIVGLLRGLGGNLNLKTRREFAKEVRTPLFLYGQRTTVKAV